MPNEGALSRDGVEEPFVPSAEESALLWGLVELIATHDVAVLDLADRVAVGLAGQFAATVIVSLIPDGGQWVEPLGVADPDPVVARTIVELVGTRLRADRGFAQQVLATRRSVRLPQVSTEVIAAARPELAAYARRFGVTSVMFAPMRVRGRPVGFLTAVRQAGGAPFALREEQFLQLVADIAAFGAPRPLTTWTEPPGEDSDVDLSEREREVLSLLALGHTNREIADRLFLSVRTVEWHRARLQWKLGVSGRAALARIARGRGLVE